MQAQRGGEITEPTLSQPRRLEVMGGHHHAPARLPAGTNRYPVYSGLDGLRGRSGRQEKSRPHRKSIPGTAARSESLYRLSCRNRRNLSAPSKILFSRQAELRKM